ncbi:MAG: Rpn family recombination-promoting nuclease/putative transposase [Alloprevotella sp.]|nr:Rpn family recombination-promoting nuclease/putative transposase [Alloprevotella sp.]
MRQTEERYISLLTDFGFKRIFGSDINKDLLIDFLNSLFNGEQVVKNVTYLNSEHVGDVYAERKAIFDVYCENEHGEKFIVEMQNAYQTYFKDRSLYYATFPIREQAPKGDNWNFKLQHVYVVALLNYDMNEEAFSHESINHDVGLLDKQTHKVFNNKLTFKYVEIARFNKDINELETNFDKWLYVLRNLSRLDNQPTYLRNEVFNRLFSQAEIARFDKKELKAYEDSLKAYRDIKNSLDTAKEEGRAEGLAEGRAEGHAEGLAEGLAEGRAKGHAEGLAEGASEKALTIARELLAMNMSIDNIKKVTGLTDDEIHNLSNTSL